MDNAQIDISYLISRHNFRAILACWFGEDWLQYLNTIVAQQIEGEIRRVCFIILIGQNLQSPSLQDIGHSNK